MVYLIHFDKPYKGVQHYLGFSLEKRLDIRISHHRNNTGARLMQVINMAGIDWKVVRTWPGKDRNFERRLKNRKESPRLCPVCRLNKVVFTDEQINWIKFMLKGCGLEGGRKNFSKTQEKKMDQLIELGIAFKSRNHSGDRLGMYHIPTEKAESIIAILKTKGVLYDS